MKTAKYYIYRNLRTGDFSIKYRGLVIANADSFIAENVTFRVSEPGRQRVIKEKRKNVHAFTVCDKYNYTKIHNVVDYLRIITYNPYKSGNFTCDGKVITSANAVLFKNSRCYLLG